MIPNDFVAAARSYVGTPFLHQGRMPGVGLDCVGLIVTAAKSIGIKLKDYTDYGREPDANRLQLEAIRQLARVQHAMPGDILLMTYIHTPRHTAIYTGQTVIHSHARLKKVIEHDIDDRFMSHVKSIWRFKEFV